MFRSSCVCFMAMACCFAGGTIFAAEPVVPLHVLYVGAHKSERAATFETFFRKHFAQVTVIDRERFNSAAAKPADVVVLDWDQSDSPMATTVVPFGKQENWTKPTMLINHAGLLVAGQWQLIGGAGCTCMDPLAYGIRDHAMFRSPLAVNLKQLQTITTPEDFRDEIAAPTIEVLPLVRDMTATQRPGWCTYVYEFPEAPELEVLSGGVNHKTPKAGGIWRQGNLLHFGFSPSPKDMSDAGQAMLVDSICYVARFTDDRPIVHTPCVFVQGKRISDRNVLKRIIDHPKRELSSLRYFADKKTAQILENMERPATAAWFQKFGNFLHADEEGKLVVDADAEQFGVGPSEASFLQNAADALNTPDRAALARLLLNRYVPEGPGSDASAEKWQAWVRDNIPYLFFSDAGGFRWYIDPLAQRRGVASIKLRGSARATLAHVAIGAGRQ